MQSETKKPTILAQLTYSSTTRGLMLLGGLVMIAVGIRLIIIGAPDPLTAIIGIVFIIIGTPIMNEYARLIYITDHEIVSKTWLSTRTILIDHTINFVVEHEPKSTQKSNSKPYVIFYISSATSSKKMKIYAEYLIDYPVFEKVLKDKIEQHVTRLSPKIRKNTQKIKQERSTRKMKDIKQKQRKIAKAIFITPGIFLILLGVYGLIEPYLYADEYHVDSVSGELFLIIVGLIISIYVGLFSD